MTCPQSELLMGEGEMNEALQEHLAGCSECRDLWGELEANRHVMSAMGLEAMPAVPIQIRPALPWWKWTSAAAAVFITVGAAWWASRPVRPPQIVSIDVKVTGIAPKEVPVQKAAIPTVLKPAILPVAHEEPLRVKMLTSDPDVVIYWLVD
jgi:hypothetical protein